MFTDKAQAVIDLAKDHAFANGAAQLNSSALLSAVASVSEAAALLVECVGSTADRLQAAFPAPMASRSCPGKLPIGPGLRALLGVARELADDVPDQVHPGLIDLRHLVCALACSREPCVLMRVTPRSRADVSRLVASWYERDGVAPVLHDLVGRLKTMRAQLLARVFGQDHAVHAFVDGLFNAEVVASADSARKSPRAVFVFAGPPGVGKTYLAECAAACLDRPFKRFDMSAFSGIQQNEQLIGMAKGFQAAHAGTLTGFVEKNPDAVLLFDEIEKTHLNTIQLFLQVLDAGTLEDKFHERAVAFRDTIIIFTTNAGRTLYERPNESGVHTVNASFHRRTILDALATERNERTGETLFPAAICSRMAAGYPLLFNHLGVNELERVGRTELRRVAELIERQHHKRITFDDLVSTCLVLREGARTDARALRSQAEGFLKGELFRFCQLFETERLDEVFARLDSLHVGLDTSGSELDSEVRLLLEMPATPRILLLATENLFSVYRSTIREVHWRCAATAEDALGVLANEDVGMVLADLWLGRSWETESSASRFDHVPFGTRALERGQEMLRKIRERVPRLPIFLLSLIDDEDGPGSGTVDDELFMACVRGGGARGLIATPFVDCLVGGWQSQRDQLAETLIETCLRLHRERAAERLGGERKVLMFDTVPHLDQDRRKATIELRSLRVTRALAAADAGEVLQDVERPQTRFDDVIGADSAKEELRFFIEYLRSPRRFAALGLKAPRGVLLHGPAGTGKTMLARATAGESNVAFLPVAATNFVTIWQGSGPQSVRDLFLRARRYAPAIVFIDEIDAIGRARSGASGSAHGEEMALDALLTEMDGFAGYAADRPVFVLAATNFRVHAADGGERDRDARMLDPALVRRFSRAILVDLPDTAGRRKYLEQRLGATEASSIPKTVLDLLAEKSTGMSIADLEQVIEAALRRTLRDKVAINPDLLLDAMDTSREGAAKDWSRDLLERVARHEAGHTIMYWLAGSWAPEVSIVARADHGGGMRRAEAELKRELRTRDELLANIRVSLGGRGAETVYYGRDAGMSTGASSDLEDATRMARQMVCRYGMDEDFGLLAAPELLSHAEAISSPAYHRLNEIAGRILRTEMEKTIELLEANRDRLDAVAKALLARNRLVRGDLEKILAPTGQASRGADPGLR